MSGVPAQREVGRYGELSEQVGEWWLPGEPGSTGPGPESADLTVVLVHGGFWRPGYDRHLEDGLAADLAGRGYRCWVPDYRSAAAGWAATLTDAAVAYDTAAARFPGSRLAVVGHSAGGHLALWLASRWSLPADAPPLLRPSPDIPRPVLSVSQAGVAALTRAAAAGVGQGAVADLLGGTPAQVPQRYAVADPLCLLPTGVRTLLLHGTRDTAVPLDQSLTYAAAAAAAGDECTLRTFRGGHDEHLDPRSVTVGELRAALAAL